NGTVTSMGSTSAPLSIKTSTLFTFPFNATQCKAVHPFWSLPLTSAPSTVKQLAILCTSPTLIARNSMSPQLSKSPNSTCPFSIAIANAVFPTLSTTRFTLHPHSPNKLAMARNCPFGAAQCNSVYPLFSP
ncbi:hypothetical protein HN51_043948, partial [Arachis hypogaea]